MRGLGIVAAIVLAFGTLPVFAQDAANGSDLYRVDLESGDLTRVGRIGTGAAVVGLAVADSSLAAGVLYALTADGELLHVPDSAPGFVLKRAEIQGLADGESLVGIDVRPATGELVAVSDASVLYVLNPESGQATAIGESFSPGVADTELGFDFNPTVDRIRVAVSSGQNLRLNPETGQVGVNPETDEPTIDGDLAYAEGDVNDGEQPAVVAAAYTNSVDGAESTQLFVIDAAQGVLALQDPPNDGVLNTIGALGVDADEMTAFDIAPTGEAFAVVNG